MSESIGAADAWDYATDIVAGLYRAILSREPDPEGLHYHSERYRQGVTAAELAADFENSPEALAKQRRPRQALLEKRQLAEGESWGFPLDYQPVGEAGRCYRERVLSGFLGRYCGGDLVLDVGYSGYDNPDKLTALPNAIGIDLDYPGYDGLTLPFAEGSVDTVFSSHCLEHIDADHHAIQDWYRVLKIGGYIVCIVPSQALYEKKRSLPSRWNADHKRMYSPASLMESFEAALKVNSYRVRHLRENDRGYNYAIPPEQHAHGPYEIELVIEKIAPPAWDLDE